MIQLAVGQNLDQTITWTKQLYTPPDLDVSKAFRLNSHHLNRLKLWLLHFNWVDVQGRIWVRLWPAYEKDICRVAAV